jgi:hypothetical protein
MAEREGLTRVAGRDPRPAGALRASKIAPRFCRTLGFEPLLLLFKTPLIQFKRQTPSTPHYGGEGGIRTLEHLLGCYSLSRRAPSTTRPPLHRGPQGYRRRLNGSNRSTGPAQRLIRRRRHVMRWHIQTGIMRSRRRRRDFHSGNDQRALGIWRIHALWDLQRWQLHGPLILLRDMTVRRQLFEYVTAAERGR